MCQPRVIVKMIVEKQVECRLAGETEVLGENLPSRHFCPSQNPTWPDPGLNPGRRGGKPATNRLSYGAALPSPRGISNFYIPKLHDPYYLPSSLLQHFIFSSPPQIIFASAYSVMEAFYSILETVLFLSISSHFT
jgi:hypothetical protein